MGSERIVAAVIRRVARERARAVLAPDLVGIYQVTVTVPEGVAPAPDSVLVVTVAGQASAAVTIAVQ